MRSLLCISTNATSHELLFAFSRRLPSGKTLPAWLLQSGPVFLRRHELSGKHDDLMEELHLVEANSLYASVRHKDGRKQSVSLNYLASCPDAQPRLVSSNLRTTYSCWNLNFAVRQ